MEYDCPCNTCTSTLISGELTTMVQAIRDMIQKPVKITSGYRCANHQEELKSKGYQTAKGRSAHEDGLAADIQVELMPGLVLAQIAESVGFTNIGVGSDFIHVDVRPGNRRWSYDGIGPQSA